MIVFYLLVFNSILIGIYWNNSNKIEIEITKYQNSYKIKIILFFLFFKL